MEAIPIVIKEIAPYHPTAIVGALLTFFISKAAFEDGLKVMLIGEGADKILEVTINIKEDLMHFILQRMLKKK